MFVSLLSLIPFPNAVAGLLIGIVNDYWPARLLVPLAWGFTWCLYLWLGEEHREFIERNAMARDRWDDNEAWRQGFRGFLRARPVLGFYFIEYGTAFFTSLVFSVLAGLAMTIIG